MLGRRDNADSGTGARRRNGRRDTYAWWEYVIMVVVGLLILGGAVMLVRVLFSGDDSATSTPTAESTFVPGCPEGEWQDPVSGSCQPLVQCDAPLVADPDTNTCVAPEPRLVDVEPKRGPAEGGTELTLTGAEFQEGATVTINGVPGVDTKVVDGSTIVTTTPPGTVYFGIDVVVTNPDGQTDALDNVFAYARPPVEYITEIVPAVGSAQGGEAVVIKGRDFAEGTLVSFGGRQARNVQFLNPEALRVTIPPSDTGKVNVNVRIPGRSTYTLEKGFTYTNQAPRRVLRVRPNEGGVAGGTAITITGTGFASNATVTVGGRKAAKVSVVGSTRITAETPPGALGKVPVAVRNPGLPAAILNNAFAYVPAPTITSVRPARIPVTGDVNVTITGTGFLDDAVVTIDGRRATDVRVVNETTIRAVAPTGKRGPAIVVVTNPGQPPARLPKAVTYVRAEEPTPSATPSPTATPKPTPTGPAQCRAITLPGQTTPLGSDLILTDADLFPASIRSPRLTGANFSGGAGSGSITWKAQPPRIVWSTPVSGSASGTITFGYQAANCAGTGTGTIAVSAN